MTVSSTFLATDGAGYELQMGRWSKRLAPLFIDFADIGGARRVLDVGCGTGSLAAALAADPARTMIHGIDAAPAYVAHAERVIRDPRVKLAIGDACALPFAAGDFDAALSMLVLQFIPASDTAIRELMRVTRPGGRVSAAVWDIRGGMTFMRMFWDTAAMIDPGALERRRRFYCRPLSLPGAIGRAFSAAGLADIVEDQITIRTDFASFDDYWAPVDGNDGPIAEYVRGLPAETKAAVKEKVRLAYEDGEADGPRSYCATALVARGTVPG
ncbi:MAG: methyltransferase domain-containing protein [Hyphomicrobiaceae bacterium]